ncbi:ribosome-associated heat shock protein implicated in the recycling of the 50S subunit [Porphyromonas crevioricanis JCM 15906]|nr:ribosome-associated heat shock protein implicated in the recycling of the 50S subunit [Porphyromonas crevioricanis JCM 15906]
MGRVTIGGQLAKPGRNVKIGDVVAVRKPPVTYSFEVLGLSTNRMGAKLVPDYMRNVTPASEYEILEMNKISGFVDRAKGLGRPTKRDRRELEQFGQNFLSGESQFNYLAAEDAKELTGTTDFDWDEDDLFDE